LDKAALAVDVISKKKVLIANPVALTTQCVYCLEVPRKAAADAEQEIAKTAFLAAALLSHTARI
jgi:AhpD family alkylhydroperoxidase